MVSKSEVIKKLGEDYFDIRETITHMQEVKKEFHGYDNAEYYELLEELVKKAGAAWEYFDNALRKEIIGPEAED